MPVINTYDRTAGEIREGNYVFGEKVVKAEPKRVNTTITLAKPVAGHTTYPFRLTDVLEVGVLEPTPEEKERAALEVQLEREEDFVKQVREWGASAVAGVEKVARRRTERIANGWGMLDYSIIDDELETWALADLGREISAVFASADDGTFHHHPGQECEYTERTPDGSRCVIASSYTPLDVAKQIVERMKHRLTSKAMQTRVLSRSTSFTSNLCEDLELWAVAEFLDSLKYASYKIVDVPSKY